MTQLEPRKQPRQPRSKALVDAILDATARILKDEGFDTVTTNRVSETAGVSIGSLYQYFPTKEALVAGVAVRHAETLAAIVGLGCITQRNRELPVVVTTIVRAILASHATDPVLRRVVIEALPRIGRPRGVEAAKFQILEEIVALLQEHKAEISVDDLRAAAFMILHTTESLTHACQSQAIGAPNFATLEAELIRMLLGYLTYPQTMKAKVSTLRR